MLNANLRGGDKLRREDVEFWNGALNSVLVAEARIKQDPCTCGECSALNTVRDLKEQIEKVFVKELEGILGRVEREAISVPRENED